ncbi:hypothetical protein WH218_17240 [Stenotrophomonas indicatrix]|uniref:hypothetical protein n=1 Tax=Stenotrophomonas indicatrix TaxID=2045451 RepID=UPI0015DF8042|nr:hypothetical protein [Stenotrophomonas indicatrix]MBA0100786.1 hypothetical protein [Stenotrophomonas indicatrix]
MKPYNTSFVRPGGLTLTVSAPCRHPRSLDFSSLARRGKYSQEMEPSPRLELVTAMHRVLSDSASTLSPDTIISYYNGIRSFFEFLADEDSSEFVRSSNCITRETSRGFLSWLEKQQLKKRWSDGTVIALFGGYQSVLRMLVDSGIADSDAHLGPVFRGTSPKRAETEGYSKDELRRIVRALREDLQAVEDGKLVLSPGPILALRATLICALTGRNEADIINARADCLSEHPFKPGQYLLSTQKRRAGRHSIVSAGEGLTGDTNSPAGPVKADVARLVMVTLQENEAERAQAPARLRDYLWLYRDNTLRGQGSLKTLKSLRNALIAFQRRHHLVDDDGERLIPSNRRLRKTLAIHLNAALSDPTRTSRVLGNSIDVAFNYYSPVTPEMEERFRFCGIALESSVRDLSKSGERRIARKYNLSSDQIQKIRSSEWSTPVGSCSEPHNGRYAPQNGSPCTKFLHCFRCPNFVVVGDEAGLHRLFSFYWMIVSERHRIGSKQWKRVYGHIVRVIDNDIATRFSPRIVTLSRERAKANPYPLWRSVAGADNE